MQSKVRLVLPILLLFFSLSSLSQEAGIYWEDQRLRADQTTLSGQRITPGQGRAFGLREDALRRRLQRLRDASQEEVIITFPDPGGGPRRYRVRERPVLSADLQERYPEIRSYVGYSLAGPPARIRFSLSHKGLQATIVSPGSPTTHYLEQAPGQRGTYLFFSRDELEPLPMGWKCKTDARTSKELPGAVTAKLFDDQQLRTYRVAVATTGEYTQYHGGSVADALAAINATLTRVNEVFERDLAIRLVLVPETDQVIYTDPNTDPFSGNFSSEVQTTLNTVIGPAGYDIGHLFHQGGENGNAGFIGAVCDDQRKGSAFASTPNPEGDRFDLDFVAHEIGHQFGANHTWSFTSEGTGVQAEPGSGSTIMGYAGITQQDDVQSAGDDYFHYYSILQISQYVATTTCSVGTPLENTPPEITPLPDFRIPRGTAFVLEGVASDPDSSDVLTYCWEQIDDGVVTRASFGPENPVGANFRSRPPVVEPARYFPLTSRVATGDLTQTEPASGSAWETVATVERDLNFALTVRDNAPGGGQLTSDLVKIQVEEEAGPFRVTSQDTPESYDIGSVQEITWDVAGTAGGPVNTQQVDIYLSTDGGLTFPQLIAENLPNTGTALVQIPRVPTEFGRFMVKAADNVFYAVNEVDFTLAEQPFLLYFDSLIAEACQPGNATFDFTYQTFGGYQEAVALEVGGLPEGLLAEFSTDTVQVDNSRVSLVLSQTGEVASGTYALEVIGTDGSIRDTVPLRLEIASDTLPEPVLIFPPDAATDIKLIPQFQWAGDALYTAYDLEIATDTSFAAPVLQRRVFDTRYHPEPLVENTEYFWRIRPLGPCGEGTFTQPASFSTITSECRTLKAPGTPVAISPVGTPVVTSVITVAEDRPVLDVKVRLDVEHTFVSDLVITLTSPQGTTISLVSNSCGEANDIDATFDAEAPPFVCGNNPAISGVVRPLGSLKAFAGESSFGQWVLTISDTAPEDGGRLNDFSLELCVEGALRPDADADGVFDDGDDLCLGTPPGAEVDVNGCQVFRFPQDQFLITAESETCIGKSDGTLSVQARAPFNYEVRVVGSGTEVADTFASTYTLGGLSPGTYEVCIGGSDGADIYQPQCYQLVIGSPEPLSVLANASPDYAVVELLLEGAQLYEITLNGQSQTVEGPSYLLDLAKGVNQLKVTAIPACKGSFETTFIRTGRPLLAPNPFRNRLEIYMPNSGEEADIAVFNTTGSLLWQGRRFPEDGKVLLDLPVLPTGLYLIRIQQGGVTNIYKAYRE